jgi:hypothetical protein
MRSCVLLVTAACLVPAAAAGAHPAASAARSCSYPRYPGSGYFTSLRVTHVSCRTGRKVLLAHYNCRIKHGRLGYCRKRVMGYSCTEKRNSIPTETDARVRCKRGHRRVVYTYQQNT